MFEPEPNEANPAPKKKWITPDVELISQTIQGGTHTHFHEATLIARGATPSVAAYFSWAICAQ